MAWATPGPATGGQPMTSAELLRQLARGGLKKRGFWDKKDYRDRLEKELDVIIGFGLEDYFLVVWDFTVRYARGILGATVGPGRGSGGGCLGVYSLGISQLDPVVENLPFSRFLNEGRIAKGSPPDVDIDFSSRVRDKVVNYLIEKYGEDHVAGIGNIGKYEARSAIKAAARALDYDYAMGEKLNEMLPPPAHGKSFSLDESYEKSPELQKIRKGPWGEEREVLELAEALEGHVEKIGVHAAGIVISPLPVSDYCPLSRSKKGLPVTQYSMEDVESLGLIKYDLLTITNLDIVEDALNLIKREKKKDINIYELPDDDKVWRLLNKGLLSGIFQLEGSDGIKGIVKRIGVKSRQDMAVCGALFRPGPLACGLTDQYIDIRHGKRKPEYIHPSLAGILDETYGTMIYQEQILNTATQLAGMDEAEADDTRRALGKKKSELMAEQKVKFINGLIEHSKWTEQQAEKIWTDIKEFSAYCFVAAHARAYAEVGYWTAWLKVNYPLEFMSCMMNHRVKKLDRFPRYIYECNELGIKVSPPDINKSQANFTIVDGVIHWGLKAVKNVGKSSSIIIKERKKEPFDSIANMILRCKGRGVNKKNWEALIKAGATDSLCKNRGLGIAELEATLEYIKEVEKYDSKCTTYNKKLKTYGERQAEIIFAKANGDKGPTPLKEPTRPVEPSLPKIPDDAEPSTQMADLEDEKELLGTYVSNHPTSLTFTETGTIDEVLGAARVGDAIKVSGILEKSAIRRSKRGKKYVSGTLTDASGEISFVGFEDLVKKKKGLLKQGSLVEISGKVQDRGDALGIIAGDIKLLARKNQPKSAMYIRSEKLLTEIGREDFLQEVGWHQNNIPFTLTIELKSGAKARIRRE